MKHTFITDLDHTIIFSEKELNTDAIPVEYIDGRPITYMTPQALLTLHELREKEDFLFIPCTLRDFTQTTRISFIKEQLPKFMVCENGGRIYIDGEEEIDYRNFIENSFNLHLDKARKVMEYVPCRIKDNGTFLTCIFSNEEDAKNWATRSIPYLSGFDFDIQYRKFYIIPHSLDKSIAVHYLINNYGIKHLITSGDGTVDMKFTKMGNHILLPSHASFTHPYAYITNETGVKSGEEILEKIKTIIEME